MYSLVTFIAIVLIVALSYITLKINWRREFKDIKDIFKRDKVRYINTYSEYDDNYPEENFYK